jgi:hypothetical protein
LQSNSASEKNLVQVANLSNLRLEEIWQDSAYFSGGPAGTCRNCDFGVITAGVSDAIDGVQPQVSFSMLRKRHTDRLGNTTYASRFIRFDKGEDLTGVQHVIGLHGAFDQAAAGGGGEIDDGVAGEDFEQPISLNDALADLSVPAGGGDRRAGKIEIRQAEFDLHGGRQNISAISRAW